MKKHFSKMKNDREAKKILKKDLSDYLDPKNFTLTSFEFAPKDKSITLRMSHSLLDAVRVTAKQRGTDYQKLIREAIEQFLRKNAA